MERRDFMKSAAAAATAPIVPLALSNALPVTAAQYAKAQDVAKNWAHVSAGNLKYVLGVDDAASQRVIAMLQKDGVLGATGPNGLNLSHKFAREHARIVAKAFEAVKPLKIAKRPSDLLDKVETALREDACDAEPPQAESVQS